MIVYIAAFVISMVLASIAQRAKAHYEEVTMGGAFASSATYRWAMFFSFLPIFVVAAIRRDVGTDMPIYSDFYIWINSGVDRFSEPMFNLLNRVAKWLFNDFQGVLVLSALATGIFCFKAMYEQSISVPISLLFLFLSGIYFNSLNQLRQGISMAIMLYAFKYVGDRKFGKYLFWIIIAYLFHASSLVYIPAFFFVRLKPSIKGYAIAFVACIAALPVLQVLFRLIMSVTRYGWYADSVYNTGAQANDFYLLGFLFQMVVMIILIYYRFVTDEVDLQYDYMMNMYFASLIMLLFTSTLNQTLRMSMCFSHCQILLMPRLINREKDRTRRIILYALLVLLFGAKCFYDVYVLGWNDVIPYSTIFA